MVALSQVRPCGSQGARLGLRGHPTAHFHPRWANRLSYPSESTRGSEYAATPPFWASELIPRGCPDRLAPSTAGSVVNSVPRSSLPGFAALRPRARRCDRAAGRVVRPVQSKPRKPEKRRHTREGASEQEAIQPKNDAGPDCASERGHAPRSGRVNGRAVDDQG